MVASASDAPGNMEGEGGGGVPEGQALISLAASQLSPRIEVQERTRLLRAWRESRFHLGNLGPVSGIRGSRSPLDCMRPDGTWAHDVAVMGSWGVCTLGVGPRTSDVCMGKRRYSMDEKMDDDATHAKPRLGVSDSDV